MMKPIRILKEGCIEISRGIMCSGAQLKGAPILIFDDWVCVCSPGSSQEYWYPRESVAYIGGYGDDWGKGGWIGKRSGGSP